MMPAAAAVAARAPGARSCSLRTVRARGPPPSGCNGGSGCWPTRRAPQRSSPSTIPVRVSPHLLRHGRRGSRGAGPPALSLGAQLREAC
eukprot:SM011354S24268  [mRNA]  locus=s11354:12:413:+ [translate_table: standard]